MQNFTYENLAGKEGSKVTVKTNKGEFELAIESVGKSKLDGSEWDSFHVVLSGDADSPLNQGTYHFTHDAFGEADLFISPNSPTEYEVHVARKRGAVAVDDSESL